MFRAINQLLLQIEQKVESDPKNAIQMLALARGQIRKLEVRSPRLTYKKGEKGLIIYLQNSKEAIPVGVIPGQSPSEISDCIRAIDDLNRKTGEEEETIAIPRPDNNEPAGEGEPGKKVELNDQVAVTDDLTVKKVGAVDESNGGV